MLQAVSWLQNIGFPELLVIFFIVLLLFGAGRLPEIARSIGKSMHAFKQGVKDVERQVEKSVDEASKS
mgnify:CR=1 FL=1